MAARLLVAANPSALVYIQYSRVIAKTVEEADELADHGDLLFFKSGATDYDVVEVKRESKANQYAYFQEAKDFYNGVIIDGVYQYTKKLRKPIMYITFNYPLTHFFIAYTKDEAKWEKREEAGNGGKKKLYYISKTVDCKFLCVKDFLEQYKKK